jgi:hypothetical protein
MSLVPGVGFELQHLGFRPVSLGTVEAPPKRQTRIMEPNDQYPSGYVRFYNEHGQPIGLDGKPGRRSTTHIPVNPDGTYPLPIGWSH